MKLPKSILLLGREIEVVEQDGITFEGKESDGLYEHSNRRILLHAGLDDTDKMDTLFHECAHSHVTQTGWDQKLNEREVELLCQLMSMYAVDMIKGLAKVKATRRKKV